MLHDTSEIKRIKASVQRGRIQRNIKTAIIIGAAASGALFNQSFLAVTATGTLVSLFLANRFKGNDDSVKPPPGS